MINIVVIILNIIYLIYSVVRGVEFDALLLDALIIMIFVLTNSILLFFLRKKIVFIPITIAVIILNIINIFFAYLSWSLSSGVI